MKKLYSFGKTNRSLIILGALSAANAFGQATDLGRFAVGLSNETLLIARNVAGAFSALCGIGIMINPEHHSTLKVVGLLVGLAFALLSQGLITWTSSF